MVTETQNFAQQLHIRERSEWAQWSQSAATWIADYLKKTTASEQATTAHLRAWSTYCLD